ncbi:RHS repeat-associated core domain-containing protein, partial [Paenibacillus sp. GCM10012307]
QVTAADETGVTSIVRWNPLGLKVAEGIMGKGMATYVYDAYGRLSYSDDAAGNRTSYTYDVWDRIVRTQFPGANNAFATALYNDIQRTVQTTDPEGSLTKETLDLLGRPIKQEAMNAAGAVKSKAEYTYDYAGNLITQKDAKGFTTTYAYDILGRLVTVTDPEANATNYVYSLAGNLKETKYPDNTQMTKQYDQMGRVIRKTDPAGGVETYVYDANSNLTKVVDRKNQARTYAYNNRDRQISSTTNQETITMGYDAAGRRLRMQDGTGTTKYSYEAGSGWLQSVTYPDNRKTEYEYDSQGKRTKMTGPFGVVSLYQYDVRNQLEAVGSAANVWDATYTYQKNGRVASAELRNGIRSTYGYDERNLTSLIHTKAGSTLEALSYRYDQNRNQTGKTERGTAYTFGYDPLNRIATSTQFNETYTYDQRGNRKSLTSDAPPEMANMSYAYDDRDRLTKVVTENNQTVTYRYDGDGLLTERTEAGVTTRYYYDGADIIAEGTVTNGAVTHKASYIRGKGLVARVDASGSRAYYSHNGHGDVTQLTDQAGNVLSSYTYDMWGNPITASETVPNLFRYSGEYWDETTGLQYLRARWYDPSVGRFMNEDTYEGEITNPLTLNLYTYVHNNPLIYSDPSGNKAWLIHGTWSNPDTWTPKFVEYVEGLFNESSRSLEWTGGNTTGARSKAAKDFLKEVYEWHLKNPDDPIRLIGHSHGGNVAIMLANLLAEKGMKVETLITIATPVRGYRLDKNTSVGQHIQLYNKADQVQLNGGSIWNLGSTLTREFKGAENVRAKDAEKPGVFSPNGGPIDSHSSMHSNIDIWKKYIEPKLKKKNYSFK